MKTWIEGEHLYVQTPYNIALIEKIKGLGGRWYEDEKHWRLSADAYNNLLVITNDPERHAKLSRDKRLNIIKSLMIRRGYSKNTIKSYMSHIDVYLDYSHDCIELGIVNQYILYLVDEKKRSHSYSNQAVNAIKLYLREFATINEQDLIRLDRPKKEKKLPKVLSKNEVKLVLDATTNVKHKTALMMAYSCGMRVSEVATIQLSHIDSQRMIVNIVQAKGNKDRITNLSRRMLEQLRTYYKQYRPNRWVFENANHDGPVSVRTLQRVFEKSLKKAGINKKVSFHSLRHSYATHLLESGVDLRYIQELLGHSSTKTTEIYTHVSTKSIQNIVNPLDRL